MENLEHAKLRRSTTNLFLTKPNIMDEVNEAIRKKHAINNILIGGQSTLDDFDQMNSVQKNEVINAALNKAKTNKKILEKIPTKS